METLVARWAPPPSDFIEVKGQIVHIRDEGPRDDALPILLIHGTSASLHTWEGWAKALKTQRRVISFDLPGFGLKAIGFAPVLAGFGPYLQLAYNNFSNQVTLVNVNAGISYSF